MALVPSMLASSLESSWLVPGAGQYPSSAFESGDKFASAVATWFGMAMAGAFPCSTATARQPQLASAAAGAFQARDPSVAGNLLAFGLMSYMTGQVFGAGVASPPAAVGAAQSAITAVFSNFNLSNAARANQMANAAFTLALSTIVVFPPVISPPLPVT